MPEITTLPDALKRIAELETQVAELETQVAALTAAAKPAAKSKREKEIQRRMTLGRISRAAAEMAVDHQELSDAQIEKEKAAKAAKAAKK